MKYQYNYSFLEKWIKANKNVPVGTILQALGSKTNNRLKAWARKECPMPVINMLRFCNTFQVPISAFFRDEEAGDNPVFVPGRPTVNDQLEPDGGYADSNDRQKGERTLLNPLDVEIIPSVIPEAEKYDTNTNHSDSIDTAQGNNTTNEISRNSLKAILDIETKHAEMENKNIEQRNRLLYIIAEQQKQIADLTRALMQERSKNSLYNENDYGFAAEPTPRP